MNDKKWPVSGGCIVNSADKQYISAVAKALYQFQADRGDGLKHKPDREDYAPEGVFALIDGELAGGLTFHVQNDWVFLHCGYVWEQNREMGLYTALMNTVEKMARKAGLSGIMTSTYEFEAPELYEKLGFRRGAVLTNCPKGNVSIDYYKDFGARE